MMAAVSLGLLEEMLTSVYQNNTLAKQARQLQATIHRGIHDYGRGSPSNAFGGGGAPCRPPCPSLPPASDASNASAEIYAYEVDGRGNRLFMDDANIPSLLSMPYLGYTSPLHSTGELYSRTRGFVLSDANPYYFRGKAASGIGSAHTSSGCIWHLSLIMEGLTGDSLEEKRNALRVLEQTTGGTGHMHESFDANNPEVYTRGWFGWAASLFSELVEDFVTLASAN